MRCVSLRRHYPGQVPWVSRLVRNLSPERLPKRICLHCQLNDLPQPQLECTFGFLILNPDPCRLST